MQQRERARAQELAASMQEGCLGVRVGALHRIVTRRFEQALRPLRLTLPQMEVLSCLTLIGEPVRPAALAGWLNIERSTMSRNLALLESRGLVVTTETSAAGRSLTLTITDTGTQALAGATATWHQVQDELVAALGPQASRALDGWLTNLMASRPDSPEPPAPTMS